MESDCDFYVFREGRRTVKGQQLLGKLRECLSRAADESGWTDALLRSGELECALEDAGSPQAELVARVTDQCAEMLVMGHFRGTPEPRLPETVPSELSVSTPEGFAYYALHPMRYADAVQSLGSLKDAVVVGIRSIGTTLSAVAGAALQGRSVNVTRFTVRPEGHPFERTLRWSESQLAPVREGLVRGATFVVVDEGPGLSGSSFLSVAEALRDAGVPDGLIVLMPAHAPDPSRLRARDVAERWEKFRCVPIGDGRRPAGEWIGGGRWRERFIPRGEEWPGAWTPMERAKFLSVEDQIVWKFEGLGPYGERSRAQASALADQGWGAPVAEFASGFIGYRCIEGTRARELSGELIRRTAGYCAFRGENFASDMSVAQQEDLATMLRVNCEREFRSAVPAALASLEVVRPAICDAKMAPHEWVQTADGRWLKLDATAHGDDHFFPGPCDIAWDLASAIVEWGMEDDAKAQLLQEYRSASGDDATSRIDAYVLAYSVFRYAWCKMAAAGMKGSDDEPRLLREYRKYRDYAQKISSVSAMR